MSPSTRSPLVDPPPLVAGDHLTRDEFERRYLAMPDSFWAELIEGRVYVTSPVRADQHGEPHLLVDAWLGHYWIFTPRVVGATNTTVRLDLDNEPQPDACLRILPEHGGQTTTSPEGYIEGAPELAVEVTASTASYDLHEKFRAYRRNGVREYVVWRVLDRKLDWFVLERGEYVRQDPDESGILRSRVFPGLWLDVHALLAREYARVLECVGEGVRSDEHAAFVQRLAGENS